ncbi:MAG: Zn-ribbon domain-containing OB-fold protein [Acidimicrobiales bacterium]
MRPAPILTEDNRSFWEAAARGRLVAQRCRGCGRLHHPPRPMCPACHGLEHEEVQLSGRGRVYSYAVLHHPRSPAFTYPLVTALVDLEEGVRMVTNLVGIEPADVRIGMPVRVTFAPTADDMCVPVFERSDVG